MRALLVITTFIVLINTVRATPTLEVPPQNRAILHSGRWTPSQSQTDAAYRSVQRFLQKPVVSESYYLQQIAEILKHRKQYRVQFIGRYHKGRKIILCSFFPIRFPEDKRDETPEWRQQLIEVMDGGFWYWRVEYDPQTDQCGDFDVNGYARSDGSNQPLQATLKAFASRLAGRSDAPLKIMKARTSQPTLASASGV